MHADPDRDDAAEAETARRELRKGLLIVGVHLAATGIALGAALWVGAGRQMPAPPSAAIQPSAPVAAPGTLDDADGRYAIRRDGTAAEASLPVTSAPPPGAQGETGLLAGLPIRVELPAPWFVDTDGRIHARDR